MERRNNYNEAIEPIVKAHPELTPYLKFDQPEAIILPGPLAWGFNLWLQPSPNCHRAAATASTSSPSHEPLYRLTGQALQHSVRACQQPRPQRNRRARRGRRQSGVHHRQSTALLHRLLREPTHGHRPGAGRDRHDHPRSQRRSLHVPASEHRLGQRGSQRAAGFDELFDPRQLCAAEHRQDDSGGRVGRARLPHPNAHLDVHIARPDDARYALRRAGGFPAAG